jgi:phosphopantothenoylcysteine decarboxylase/phosphopantothenate--cysteine ligase
MASLAGKRILLVIAGGIAAYKSLDLIRRLRERGASVHAVMTDAAQHFVTPLSVASLSGEKVHTDLFSLTDEAEMGHIELSRDADLVVIAPATADILAKLANGLAGDLASTLLLATDKKILAAPAMNLRMWLHPATQRNVAILRADGVAFIGPDDGEMACGEYGPGRMSEPLAIVAAIENIFASGDTSLALPPGVGVRPNQKSGPLVGQKVVVTSGPTHEPIDPVRYIANRSSGKQGHAIAAAAARAGADVILVSGPVSVPDPNGVRVVHVETAREMLDAVRAALPADIFISTAAVADWRVDQASGDKVKKSGGAPPALQLVENPDILATVSQLDAQRPRLVVGFAAETTNLIEHAQQKLLRKKCDLIVANDVGAGGVMGSEFNTVHIVERGKVTDWPRLDKQQVAERLIALCAEKLTGKA